MQNQMDSKMKSKMQNEMGTVIIRPIIGIRASKKQGFRFKIKDYIYRGPLLPGKGFG